MEHGRQALVLSYVHSQLLLKNLEVAVHEARVDKDPDYRMLADSMKILKQRVEKTFAVINKKMEKSGVDMNKVEEELIELHNNTWV